MPLIFAAVVLCSFGASAMGHTYHLGACPTVEPFQGFDINKLLGKWYVIQKTSTASRCLTYNFTESSEPGLYSVEQISEHPILGLASVDNKYHYTGKISVPSFDTPAKMVVQFPLSVAGSASYIVFSTDYDTYAGIFTCQKLTLAHRQSATILSRKKTLDKLYVDKLRSKLSSFGIDPYSLSIIDQTNCPKDNDNSGVNINIDDDTFSPQNIAGVVRKAGDKLGDGVEYAAEGAKKVYHALSDDKTKRSREELNEHQDNSATEWLP